MGKVMTEYVIFFVEDYDDHVKKMVEEISEAIIETKKLEEKIGKNLDYFTVDDIW